MSCSVRSLARFSCSSRSRCCCSRLQQQATDGSESGGSLAMENAVLAHYWAPRTCAPARKGVRWRVRGARRVRGMSGTNRRMFSSRFAASISRFRAACLQARTHGVSDPPARLQAASAARRAGRVGARRSGCGGSSRAAQEKQCGSPARRFRSGAAHREWHPRPVPRTATRRARLASPCGCPPSSPVRVIAPGNGFRWRNTLLAFANTVVPESTHVRGRTAEALAAQGSS